MHAAVSGILRILLMAAAASGLWSAEVPSPALPSSHTELLPAIALSYRVEHLKAAFRSGDPTQLQEAVQEVEVLRRTYNTLDVLPLVEAMAIYARQLGDAHRPELGLEVVQTVERWAPRYPTLLGTRVILLRQQGFATW